MKSTIRQLVIDAGNNIVILLAMLYIMCKLTCNPLFFRQLNLSFDLINLDIRIISSSLLFPVTYILSDLISAIAGRATTILIIMVGVLCDGLFSFIVHFVATLPIPSSMTTGQLQNTQAVNTVGLQIWDLFVHGALATIVSNVAEVLIFYKLFRKINNFFISTVMSVILILVFHNLITDYPMLKSQPGAWLIIFNGLGVNMSIMIIYAALFSVLIWLKKKLSNKLIAA